MKSEGIWTDGRNKITCSVEYDMRGLEDLVKQKYVEDNTVTTVSFPDGRVFRIIHKCPVCKCVSEIVRGRKIALKGQFNPDDFLIVCDAE